MREWINLLVAFLFLTSLTTHAAQISWSLPSSYISSSGVDASSPLTVIDNSGNATAIWLENGVVMASSLPFGGSWSAASAISGASSSLPSLRIDGSGNVTALWLQSGAVTSATLPFGGSWSATTTVSSTTADTPKLAVDTSGNAVAVWTRNGTVEASIKPAGSSWGAVTVVSGTSVSNTYDAPQISIGSNGTVVAIWHLFTASSSSHSIQSATATIAGLTWNAPLNVTVASSSFVQNYPKIVVDGSGNATAVWFRYKVVGTEYENVMLISASLTSGATAWSVPTFISGQHHRNPATLTLAVRVDANNNVIALWNPSYDGSTFTVESATIQSGGSWSSFSPATIYDTYALAASLAIDTEGNAVTLFMSNMQGTGSSIASSESDIGSVVPNAWTIPQFISSGTTNGYPSVSRSLNGTTTYAMAVWITNDGTNNRVVSSTGSATLLGAPTNLTVVQSSTNYGSFTEYYNTVSWTASTDPNVVGYVVYRNGVLFTQVLSNTVQVIDHNQMQNGSITYSVVAYDKMFLQSPTISKSFP